MGNNESMLLEISGIHIKNIDFRLNLTDRRLILSSNGNVTSEQMDIPLPVIKSQVPGLNDLGEPVLTLSIKAPDGSDKRISLVFSRNSYGNRFEERDLVLDEIERNCSHLRRNGSGGSENSGAKYSYFQRNSGSLAGHENCAFRPPPPPPNLGNSFHRESFVNSGEGSYCNGIQNPNLSPYREGDNPRADYRMNGFLGNSAGFVGNNPTRNPSHGRKKNTAFSGTSKTRRNRPQKRNYDDLDIFGGGRVDTDSVAGTILGFIKSPSETFRLTGRKELREVLPVLLVSICIFAFGNPLFLGIISSSVDPSAYPALSALSDGGTLLFITVEIVIFDLLFVLLNGVLLHLVSSYEGYSDDVEDSLRIVGYSSVPYAVGGIIPIFGLIIAPLWSLVLQVTGIRETFSMDQNQAMITALIPAAIFAMLFFVFIILGGDNFAFFGGS